MTMRMGAWARAAAAAAVLLAAAGPASAARMQGFAAVAARGEALEVKGAGFFPSGRFTLGGAAGSFKRGAVTSSRSAGFGGTSLSRTQQRGELSFALADPSGPLAGDCAYAQRERAVARGDVEVSQTTAPLEYRCRFTASGRPIGELVLWAAPEGRFGQMQARRGEARFEGGRVYGVISAHALEGARWPTASPVGYLIDQGADPVAAVDRSGLTARVALPREAGQRRDAALVALALALVWDQNVDD